MNEQQRADITDERLRYYRNRMQQEGATPVFCVGTTPDGKAIVCLPDGLPVKDVQRVVAELNRLLDAECGE